MPEVGSMQIVVGPKLWEWSSFADWVNKAPSRFRNFRLRGSQVISIDAKFRVCMLGKEFMRARDEGAFPIAVYAIDPDFVVE